MPPTSDRPNVLIVIMDDLAFGDLACHGNPHAATPHLDQLHRESTRLVRHCSGPLCTPARAALLTGRHHLRTGAIDTYLGRSTLHDDEVTLAELMQRAGYATGMFGKWHVGEHWPSRPQDRGFEQSLWHRGGGIGQPGDFRGNTYFDPVLEHNGTPVTSCGYCTDVFGEAAERFIRGAAGDGRPWLCYLGTNAPHSPFQVPDALCQPYRERGLPEMLCRVYAMVQNIDDNVGRLLRALEETGQAANTIVIYTSDHGPCGSANVDGKPRFNAGLRDRKGTLYEGGIRVPMFLRWPGRLPAGVDVDRVTSPMDVLPTLAAACGFDVPNDRVIDGDDLTPLLTGAADLWPDRTVMMQWHRGDAPQRWRNAAVLTQRYKLYRPGSGWRDDAGPGDFELYDIQHDPGETRDLTHALPAVVEELGERYERWFDELAAERGEQTWAAIPTRLGRAEERLVDLTWQDWRLYPGLSEGWSTDRPGYWPVEVTQPGPYELTVFLPTSALPSATPLTLTLACGSWRIARTLPPHEAQVERFVAQLPPGRHDLHALIEGASARLGVERVQVRAL